MRLKYQRILAVITDDITWCDFRLVAAAIEQEAHAMDHYVLFLNGPGNDRRLQQLVTLAQADGYLISRQLFLRAQEKTLIVIEKPYQFIDDHFFCRQTTPETLVPADTLTKIISTVKYVCFNTLP